jgi:hypothetical protein
MEMWIKLGGGMGVPPKLFMNLGETPVRPLRLIALDKPLH